MISGNIVHLYYYVPGYVSRRKREYNTMMILHLRKTQDESTLCISFREDSARELRQKKVTFTPMGYGILILLLERYKNHSF